MAGYLLSYYYYFIIYFFFCMFMDQDGVVDHKHAKIEQGQYPAILSEQAWSIKDLLHGKRTCGLWGTVGNPKWAR